MLWVESYLSSVHMTDQISCDEILDILRSNYLFTGLTDTELVDVVHSVEVYQVERGTTISREGEKSSALYIIQSGKACQTRQAKGKETFLKQLTVGNSWGEDCIQDRSHIHYRIAAISTVLVIRIDRAILLELAGRIPLLAANLQIGGRARNMQDNTDLDWLQNGEEIIYMCRKHPLFLIGKIILPIIVFLVVLFGTAAIADLGDGDIVTIWLVGLFLLFACLVWAGWNALDWTNDYSIVTNMRVVWLEKVFGLYDTRQETPLTTMQSINVQSSQLGRIFDYGDVIVRTYTGPLTLPDVESPDDVANLIREHWEQSRQRRRQTDLSGIEQTLRMRLNQGTGQTGQTTATTPQPPVAQVDPGFLQEMFADFFKVRIESDGMITYRKHWYVLVMMTWKPILVSLILLAVWLIRMGDGFTFISAGATLGFISFIWVGMLGWMIYQYADWRNDRFQITNDQVIDLDKTPLGKEEKKIAQLDNILSIEYKRIGIMGLLLNFGTVYITIGNGQFTFDQVYDPSQVQQDLFRRMAEREFRKKQEDIQSEHERVSDWIATYHNHQDEFRTNTGPVKLSSQPDGIG